MVVQLKRPSRAKWDRAYEARHPERRAIQAVASARWKKAAPDEGQFIAIDSEGFSFGETTVRDDKSYRPHKTFLWGASGIEGQTEWLQSEKGLRTRQICEWLLKLPKVFPARSIFVSFSFSYDAAQIVADLPYEVLWELQRGIPFDHPEMRKNNRRVVLWGDYGFSYLKSKRFAIYKFPPGASAYVATKNGGYRLNTVAKLLIYDVFGFFQSSFIKAAQSMPGAINKQELDILLHGKSNRANFDPSQSHTIKRYTEIELRTLARMMTKLREAMLGEDIHVRQWYGAGSIAEALLKREAVKHHFAEVRTRDLCEHQIWAHHAYFGGRIELLHQGATEKALFGYDIASAYPAIAATLPSMQHGEWRYVVNPTRSQIEQMSCLSIFHIKSHSMITAPFYPLPYRTPKGSILFPRQVNGYYMQSEVSAAYEWCDKFGGELECIDAWVFDVRSVVRPFAFIQKLFDYRLTLSKEDITQIVVKLGINSCYGKLAQAVAGNNDKPPAFANPWYAAAITAGTRARLLQAALLSPVDIVMLATDGVISRAPLSLSIPKSKTLGAWESGILERGGVLVQSGVYTISDDKGIDHAKSRGFRPTHMSTTPEGLMRDAIPALWLQDHKSLEFSYQNYMTLGASVASRELAPFIGMWVDGKRNLDLRGAGIKRNVSDSSKERRARAHKLVATEPCNANMLLIDANGEMPLSAMSVPDWLDPEFGLQAMIDDEQDEIQAARFT